MIDLKHLDWAALDAMEKAIKAEKESRNKARHDALVKNLCDAWNALHLEFPNTSLEIEGNCRECGREFDIDLLEYFERLTPSDFTNCW